MSECGGFLQARGVLPVADDQADRKIGVRWRESRTMAVKLLPRPERRTATFPLFMMMLIMYLKCHRVG